METKQIIDLPSADSFDEGDLLLVRKTGLGVDKKINYANFLKSIGSNFVNSYVAKQDVIRKNVLLLEHASNMKLDKYYSGMKVSFEAPATIDTVQIAIAGLEYVELFNYGTKDRAKIKQGEYVEAVYLEDEKKQKLFYRLNHKIELIDLPPADSFDEGDLLVVRKKGLSVDKKINYANFLKSIGSNFVSGCTARQDTRNKNAVVLEHASGLIIDKYYSGMKVSFEAPITSNEVQIKLSELESAELFNHGTKDKAKIKQGEYIEAVYFEDEKKQKAFYLVNNRYSAFPQDPILTVGKNGDCSSINEAIAKLEQQYFEIDKTTFKARIKLLTGFVIRESITIEDKNLSWITLVSDDEINLDVDYLNHISHFDRVFLLVTRAKSINLELKLKAICSKVDSKTGAVFARGRALIKLLGDSRITINNSSFNNSFGRVIEADGSEIEINQTKFKTYSNINLFYNSCINSRNGRLTINDCIIKGDFLYGISLNKGSLKAKSLKISIKSNISRGLVTRGDGNGTCFSHNIVDLTDVEIYAGSPAEFCDFEVKMNKCRFESSEKSPIFISKSNFHIKDSFFKSCKGLVATYEDSTGTLINSTFEQLVDNNPVNINAALCIEKNSKVTLTDCKVIASSKEKINQFKTIPTPNLIVNKSEVNIDGGNYQSNDQNNRNIIASYNSTIKLINSPQGGSSHDETSKIIKG